MKSQTTSIHGVLAATSLLLWTLGAGAQVLGQASGEPVPTEPEAASPEGEGAARLEPSRLQVTRGAGGALRFEIASSQRRRLRALAFAPDGRHLALGGEYDELHFLDARTGEVAWSARFPMRRPGEAEHVESLAFRGAGGALFVGTSRGRVLSVLTDRGTLQASVQAQRAPVQALVACEDLPRVALVDPEAGLRVLSFPLEGRDGRMSGEPVNEVTTVAAVWPHTLRNLGGSDSWRFTAVPREQAGFLVAAPRDPRSGLRVGMAGSSLGRLTALAMRLPGRDLAAGDASGRLQLAGGAGSGSRELGAAVTALDLAGGLVAAGTSGGRLEVLRPGTGAPVLAVLAHDGGVRRTALGPAAGVAASLGVAGIVRLWELPEVPDQSAARSGPTT